MEDERLPLSNSAAGREIRPVAMGRKDFYYAGSPKSGEVIAILFSLLRSAIPCGHNPWDHHKDILARMHRPRPKSPRPSPSPLAFCVAIKPIGPALPQVG
ncbi:MAG: hypothetical protein ACYDCX_01200 [Acidithiobacillus sp.]